MGKPAFMIVGAMRSGTTSLYASVCAHSRVGRARNKEINYYWKWYESHDFEWYQSQFSKGYTGEASHNYMLFSDVCSERIHADFPNIKLIAILRNPIDRAYSHYHLQKQWDDLSFENAIVAEPERLASLDPFSFHYARKAYLKRGDYAAQLQPYISLFGRENILVLQSEKFFKERQTVLARIFSFLELEPEEIEPIPLQKIEYPPMDKDTRYLLNAYFVMKNENLYDLIGESFDW